MSYGAALTMLPKFQPSSLAEASTLQIIHCEASTQFQPSSLAEASTFHYHSQTLACQDFNPRASQRPRHYDNLIAQINNDFNPRASQRPRLIIILDWFCCFNISTLEPRRGLDLEGEGGSAMLTISTLEPRRGLDTPIWRSNSRIKISTLEPRRGLDRKCKTSQGR